MNLNDVDIDLLAMELDAHPDFKVVRRFQPKTCYRQGTPPEGKLGRGILLDTETTGRDPAIDKIIEIGLVAFTYDRETGEAYEVTDTFNALEDPEMPIPPEASRVNNITDEMVKGQRIDDDKVESLVTQADIILAHNSSFDRAFCEPRFDFFKHKPWGCSRAQIDWDSEGIGSAKLEFIAYRYGFFYEGHRAEIDCLALLEVLDRPLPVSGKRGLLQILENSRNKELRVWAVEAPFEKKGLLQARGYRWGDGTNGKEKAWHTVLLPEKLDEEVEWLRANVYSRRPFRLVVDTVDAFSRFSTRRANIETLRL